MRAFPLSLALLAFSLAASAQQNPGPPDVSTSGPLPPMRELFLDLDRNEKTVEAKARDYTYHVHSEEQDLDGKGGLKKTTITDAESLTVDGVRVNRIVARDGKPLTPEEAAKENERIDKAVAKAHQRVEKHEEKGEDTNSRGDTLLTASRILELGILANPRREMLNGRSTIVMDYIGNPEAKTHGPTEGMIRDIVGTVWVDVADRVLARGEGRFLNDFKIGGGLLINIHKGFSFAFAASKVNGDVWLPAFFEGQGSARLLLFKGVNGRLHASISDYRKFRTGVTILPSSHVLDENGKPLPDQPVLAPLSTPQNDVDKSLKSPQP